MRGSSVLFGLAVLVPGVALAESLQIQIRGSVPERLSVQVVAMDSLSAKCAGNPCRVSSNELRIQRNPKGVGVLNVPIPNGATQVCLQKLRSHRIAGARMFFRDDRPAMAMKRGGEIARDGLSGCTPKAVDIADGRIWVVNIEEVR